MDKNTKIVLGVFFSLVFIVSFIMIIINSANNNFTSSVINDEKNCKEEIYTETVPYIETICNDEELAYKIENFILEENTCNEEEFICRKDVLGVC